MFVFLLAVSLVHGEPLTPDGWHALVRHSQRHVAQATPEAASALLTLRNLQVEDPGGELHTVRDGQLEPMAQRLSEERRGSSSAPSELSLRTCALHLHLLEKEARRLAEEPPPPYSAALRPDGALFTTAAAPPMPAEEPSSIDPLVWEGWTRIRSWAALTLTGRGSQPQGTALLLVAMSVAIIALALWPALRHLGFASQRAPAFRSPSHKTSASPLGERLNRLLELLERRQLLRKPRFRTNRENLGQLPDAERSAMKPAFEIHDLLCYGERPLDEAGQAAMDHAARRLRELR